MFFIQNKYELSIFKHKYSNYVNCNTLSLIIENYNKMHE